VVSSSRPLNTFLSTRGRSSIKTAVTLRSLKSIGRRSTHRIATRTLAGSSSRRVQESSGSRHRSGPSKMPAPLPTAIRRRSSTSTRSSEWAATISRCGDGPIRAAHCSGPWRTWIGRDWAGPLAWAHVNRRVCSAGERKAHRRAPTFELSTLVLVLVESGSSKRAARPSASFVRPALPIHATRARPSAAAIDGRAPSCPEEHRNPRRVRPAAAPWPPAR
jgi:hypothetical protein